MLTKPEALFIGDAEALLLALMKNDSDFPRLFAEELVLSLTTSIVFAFLLQVISFRRYFY